MAWQHFHHNELHPLHLRALHTHAQLAWSEQESAYCLHVITLAHFLNMPGTLPWSLSPLTLTSL